MLPYLLLLILFPQLSIALNIWNSPYTKTNDENTFYASFSEAPKYLDPAKSYSAGEWLFINQIYEPPLQYHYLDRPYKLVPLSASKMPKVILLDKNKKSLPPDTEAANVAFTRYIIDLKKNVYFQPHPAFIKQKP